MSSARADTIKSSTAAATWRTTASTSSFYHIEQYKVQQYLDCSTTDASYGCTATSARMYCARELLLYGACGQYVSLQL
eukprot:21277-Heterococcus_DN1.PRE.1